jgi:hypothetical protein
MNDCVEQARRLELLKEKEEEERLKTMNNNKNKAKLDNGGGTENAGPVEPRKNSNATQQKTRHRSGSIGDIEERKKLVIWRRPLTTVYFCFREIPCAVVDAWHR